MQFVDNVKTLIRNQLNGFRKAADIASNGACLVLLYHRVSDYVTDPQLLCVTPENFDKQIKYLVEKYNVLTVEEFYSIISKNEKFPDKSVLLTFDDGYADNFIYALPILEKHSAQALFYICPGNFETRYRILVGRS
jgi:peptidoglycan/xylan/chitin deacetylase (PgdA/CDA1 family)